VGIEDLSAVIRDATGGDASEGDAEGFYIPYGTPLEEVERRIIRRTLERTGGDKKLAARLLGIAARTIYRKLDE
jgi:two-component system response regulator HydG